MGPSLEMQPLPLYKLGEFTLEGDGPQSKEWRKVGNNRLYSWCDGDATSRGVPRISKHPQKLYGAGTAPPAPNFEFLPPDL